MVSMPKRTSVAGALLLILAAVPVRAEVSRVEILTRQDVLGGRAFGSTGPYERIVGRLHLTVDPAHPRNRLVVDIDRAPVNAAGRVAFTADLTILRPRDATRGNGIALVDIPNRGRKVALSAFNRAAGTGDLTTEAEAGDGFLFEQGYTIVWIGWEFDVAGRGDAMRVDVPIARGTTGTVHATLTPNARTAELTANDLAAYPPTAAASTARRLSRRDSRASEAVPIPLDRWRLDGNIVSLDGGFDAGAVYELSYPAADSPVAGLGFVAVRDTAAWLKYSADAVAPARYALAFGLSQSGRFLRDFLYQGFNADERDRLVFDAVMPHIAGASRIDLNRRWATPVSQGQFSETSFPFADAALRDPVTGVTEGALENPRARAHQPKVFYTNTGVEYWGGARSAALIHTTPDGSADLTLPANVRVYFLTGTQHGPSRFPPSIGTGQQLGNPNDYWWTMRGLLVAMQRWIVDDAEPPPSRHPRLDDGTLVRSTAVAFPDLPSVASPRGIVAGQRAANALVAKQGGPGTPLPLLVPQVDGDGNERAGIRQPDITVPLGTYTGWNFRNPRIGSPRETFPLLGSYVPLPATRAAGARAGDPRASVDERYPTRARYLALVEEAAAALAEDRYLRAADLPLILGQAGEHWDWLASRDGADVSAGLAR
jgi:hypothetical protein